MSFSRWIPFLIVLFFWGAILSSPWLITFSVVVAVVIGLAYLWRRHSLDNLVYQRRLHYHRGFPGERTPLKIIVENRKWLPVSWLRTIDPWNRAVAPENEDALAPSHIHDQGLLVNLYSFRWFEKTIRDYTLLFRRRGYYPIGPVVLESGDLFGLYEQTLEKGKPEYLTVFPELLPLQSLNLPTEDPFGELRSRRRVFEDPNRTIGVRPYQPEDDFRRIHWNATARTGSLQVKVYQPVSSRVLMVCLNISTSSQPWMGIYQELFEYLIKVCATLVYEGVHAGYSVGLLSNSYVIQSDRPLRILPGRSMEHLALLLQSLASITPYTVMPFEAYLGRSLSQLPFGATLVAVTALLPATLIETFLRLRRYHNHTTIISLDAIPPPDLPGIRTVYIPFEKK